MKIELEKIKLFRKIIFPLVMSIITFLIGSFFVYFTIGVPLKGELIIILISYLPFLLFLLNTILIYKYQEKNNIVITFNVLSIILTCLLFFYYIIAMFCIVLVQIKNPNINPVFYKQYISGKRVEKVFPSKIPKDVENVEFLYNPPLFQGGMNHYLYYVDEKMTTETFNKKYKSKAIWIGHKDEYTEKNGLLSGNLLMNDKNDNDFIIYLIEGECDNSGYCNHGSYLLTAFNEKTKEVIYKSEVW